MLVKPDRYSTKEEFIAYYSRQRIRCPMQAMIVGNEELDNHIATYGPFSATLPAPGAEPWTVISDDSPCPGRAGTGAHLAFATFEPDVSGYDYDVVSAECQALRAEIAATQPLINMAEFYHD